MGGVVIYTRHPRGVGRGPTATHLFYGPALDLLDNINDDDGTGFNSKVPIFLLSSSLSFRKLRRYIVAELSEILTGVV